MADNAIERIKQLDKERSSLIDTAKKAALGRMKVSGITGSRPHLAYVFQASRKSANIHATLGVIWGILAECVSA